MMTLLTKTGLPTVSAEFLMAEPIYTPRAHAVECNIADHSGRAR